MRRLLFTVIFLVPLCCLAQRENDVWYFGAGAGLSFASGTPTPILGPLSTQEGTATVCDASTGALLFTTDGVRVFDRNLALMPNGTGLEGGWSSTQSALIIPMPLSTSRYYVFTAGDLSNGNPTNPGLHYNIVDMSMNGGLGDVAVKNIRLLDSCAEKLHATIHCDGESYWVVAHDNNRPRFYMYKVTSVGIEPPVVSDVGMQFVNPDTRLPGGNYGLGLVKFSASGSRIAIANPHSKLCEVFDVDLRRGIIYNSRLVDTARSFYGLAFSPNENLLYVTTWNEVLQYNVLSPSIPASRTILGPIASATGVDYRGGIQRGPDGVMYVADGNQLQTITSPDTRGLGCGYGLSSITLLASTRTFIGLPNIIDGQFLTAPIVACIAPVADFTCDSVGCAGSCLTFVNNSTSNTTSWLWQIAGGSPNTFNGESPGAVCFNVAGTFVVRLIASNENGADTIERTVRIAAQPTVSAGVDINFCRDVLTRLYATGCVRYSWSPASGVSDASVADPTITSSQTTTFIVTGWDAVGCTNVDTIVATLLEPAALIMNNVVCRVSQRATFVVQHPTGDFDSCDVSLRYNGARMSDVTVSVGEVLIRGLMPDGRDFIRMRLRNRMADDVVAIVSGTTMLNTVLDDSLECMVESSYGCRAVTSTEATLTFDGCALNLRNIKVSANTMLLRTIYNVDGRLVQSDEVQYDRWEEQPVMSQFAPAGLYVEVLALNGSVVHRRTFTRGYE